MDVTKQLERFNLQYGGMGSTAPANLAVNRRLDYAAGNSINAPVVETIAATPVVLNFENAVGLFGAENTFVKVQLNINSTLIQQDSFEDPDGYLTATYLRSAVEGDVGYDAAFVDDLADTSTLNDYDPAGNPSSLAELVDAVVSVDLENLKTGNIYIDNYLDMQLYGPDKQPLSSDNVYVGIKDHFYIGFHARRTKRLPYRAKLTIGTQYISSIEMTDEQRRYLVTQ